MKWQVFHEVNCDHVMWQVFHEVSCDHVMWQVFHEVSCDHVMWQVFHEVSCDHVMWQVFHGTDVWHCGRGGPLQGVCPLVHQLHCLWRKTGSLQGHDGDWLSPPCGALYLQHHSIQATTCSGERSDTPLLHPTTTSHLFQLSPFFWWVFNPADLHMLESATCLTCFCGCWTIIE